MVQPSDNDCLLVWASTHGAHIPASALKGGHNSANKDLFICRVTMEGKQLIGKVNPGHEVCYVPRDGQEVSQTHYEILVATHVSPSMVSTTVSSVSQVFVTSPVSKYFTQSQDRPISQPYTQTSGEP